MGANQKGIGAIPIRDLCLDILCDVIIAINLHGGQDSAVGQNGLIGDARIIRVEDLRGGIR